MAFSVKFRSGHAKRKRDVLEVMCDEREAAVHTHVRREEKALAATDPLKTPRAFLEVDSFVALHKKTSVARRRPVLVVIGPTDLGKSVLAAHVLELVGREHGLTDFLEVTVEAGETIGFSDFDVRKHAWGAT